MSDILCVNARKFCHIILTEGGTIEDAREALKTIRQPSKGYYPIKDIYDFVRKRKIQKCKE